MAKFRDPNLPPLVRKYAGQQVVDVLTEIRARGFKVSKRGNILHLYPNNQVEIVHPGGRIEALNPEELQMHVLGHLKQQAEMATSEGDVWKQRHYRNGYSFLVLHWKGVRR